MTLPQALIAIFVLVVVEWFVLALWESRKPRTFPPCKPPPKPHTWWVTQLDGSIQPQSHPPEETTMPLSAGPNCRCIIEAPCAWCGEPGNVRLPCGACGGPR